MKSIFGIRDKKAEHHWKKFDLENFQIDKKPTILCLSGSGTISEVDANGFCKLAESLLGDMAEEINLVGISYGFDESNNSKTGALSLEERKLLVQKFLIPLCVDENNTMLDMNSCLKNLSSLTFFTFCHGGTEIEEIMNIFNEELENRGMDEKDIKELGKAFLQVSYADESTRVSCPKINMFSRADSEGGTFDYWNFKDEDEAEKFYGCAMVCDAPGQYCGKDFPQKREYGSITICASSILKNQKEESSWDDLKPQDEEHNIGYFVVDESGELNDNLNENGQKLRHIMEFCLQSRIKNSFENSNQNEFHRFYLKDLYSDLSSKVIKNEKPISL